MPLIPTHSRWENIVIDLCRHCKSVIVFESSKVNLNNLPDNIREHIPEGAKTISVNPAECHCGYKQTNSIRSALAYRFNCPSCEKLVVVPREPSEIFRTESGSIVHRYQHGDICCECGEVLRACLVNDQPVVMIVVEDQEKVWEFPTALVVTAVSCFIALVVAICTV